jgi:hypothetical protein
MRDYIRELLETWTARGEQAAYVLASNLLQDIRNDVVRLRRQESAIQALGAVLKEHPAVDTSADPVDSDPDLDPIEPSERSRVIIEAAGEVYRNRENNTWTATGTELVKTQEVLDHLRSKGLDLGVQQPLAVIGTVLANAVGFQRVARNTFEVREDKPQSPYDDVDDLPF